MARTEELILYRDFEHGEILSEMTWIMEHCQEKDAAVRERFFTCMHGLIDMAGTYGFEP